MYHELSAAVPTRDAATTRAPASPRAPLDVANILGSAARIVEAATNAGKIATASTRDMMPTPKQIEADRLGPFLVGVMPVLESFGRRLRALEAKRARQTAEPPTPARPAPTTKDTAMPRNLGLAPNSHLTFPTSTRDRSWSLGQIFGETPSGSRFDSAEADRMARYLPEGSAGLPSRAELTQRPNMQLEANTYFGERGVPIDENTRFSNAPRTTRENAINIRAGVHDDDPSKAFADALRAAPSPNAAINILHKAVASTQDSVMLDKIQKIWGNHMKEDGK